MDWKRGNWTTRTRPFENGHQDGWPRRRCVCGRVGSAPCVALPGPRTQQRLARPRPNPLGGYAETWRKQTIATLVGEGPGRLSGKSPDPAEASQPLWEVRTTKQGLAVFEIRRCRTKSEQNVRRSGWAVNGGAAEAASTTRGAHFQGSRRSGWLCDASRLHGALDHRKTIPISTCRGPRRRDGRVRVEDVFVARRAPART